MTVSSVAAGAALPPVVPGSLLMGSALDLRRDMPAACERAQAEYGDAVRFRLGPPGLRRDLYVFFHPDAARRVLAVTAENYRKDNVFNTEVRRVFGNGLLTSQDAEWQRQKRFLQPLFTPRRVAGYADVIGEVVEEHAGQLRARGGGWVDLYDAMTRLTLQIIGRVLFGDDVREALPVVRSAAPLSGAVNRRGTAPLRLPLAVPTPTNRVVVTAQRALYGVCDTIIARRRSGPGGQHDLLGLLLEARDDGDRLTDTQVRDQVLVFLLAGHETTAIALAFALHLLGSHPQAQRRVREEVDDVVGGDVPTATHAAALTWTTMVLKEAMRLYPSAPFLGRSALHADRIGEQDVPAGAQVVLSPWVTHRHPRFWDEPEHFRPERFAPDAERGRHRYAWFPFGGGPRACIGQTLSLLEGVIALAVLVRDFDFTAPPGRVSYTTAITLRPAGGLPSLITPARRHDAPAGPTARTSPE
jgi:cytochrome P450